MTDGGHDDRSNGSVPCTLCGGKSFHSLQQNIPKFTQGVGPDVFRAVRCMNCGLGRTEPILNDAELNTHYRDFGPHRVSDISEKALLRMRLAARPGLRAHALRSLYKARHAPFAPFFGVTGRLLDIGCGSGDFMVRMKNIGWEVAGHDVYSGAGSLARDHGCRVEIGTVSELNRVFTEKFDLVTAWHALEHMRQPKEFAQTALSLLRRGGCLVIEVPNLDALERWITGPNWWLWMPPIHLTHWSPQPLRRLLADAGFDRIRFSTHGSHLAHSLKVMNPYIRHIVSMLAAGTQEVLGRGSNLRVVAEVP